MRHILSSKQMRESITRGIGQLWGNTLKARSVRSVAVLSVGTGIERGLRLVRNMILARILAPDEFGLMAIINIVAMALEAIAEVGVKQSVIQNKKGAELHFLNVAWWVQVVRALCLYCIAFFMAPWVSTFYNMPELVRLLRVACIAVVLRGFVSPRAFLLEKEYKFGRVVFLIQGSAILGAIVSVAVALMMPNVWALVIGLLSEYFLVFVLSFVLAPHLPRFQMDSKCLSEIMKFARGMLGLSILVLLANQTDVLVLGKIVTEQQLGAYYLVATLVLLPSTVFLRTVSPVLLPAFVEIQDRKELLRQNTVRLLRLTFVLGAPIAIIVAFSGKTILFLVYGPTYAKFALPFGILCFVVLFRIQGYILASVYMAIGKPQLIRRFAILLAALVAVTVYFSARLFGIVGATGALLLSNSIAVLMQVLWMRKTIDLKLQDYICFWVRSTAC